MQRAAAAAAANTPSGAQSPSVEDPDSPSPKRPRLSATSSPATPSADLQAISAAIAAEEQKRAEALARQAVEAGETEWVLDFPGAEGSSSTPTPAGYYGAGSVLSAYPGQPMIVPAGSLDADDDLVYGGRRSYGNFKRKKQNEVSSRSVFFFKPLFLFSLFFYF